MFRRHPRSSTDFEQNRHKLVQTGSQALDALFEGKTMPRCRTGDLSRLWPHRCLCSTRLKTLALCRAGSGTSSQYMGDVSLGELDEIIFPFDRVLGFAAALVGADGGSRLT
jgi:hypothetical protein